MGLVTELKVSKAVTQALIRLLHAENGEFDGMPQREHTSLPQDIILTNISHDLG